MASELTFKDISGEVYRLDEKHDKHIDFDVDDIKEFGGREYQVLKTEDNTNNGMQAMAVAPVNDGKADTSEVIIAYAGTNFDDVLDIYTDVQTVVRKKPSSICIY